MQRDKYSLRFLTETCRAVGTVLLFLWLSTCAHADFSDDYAPSKWTVNKYGGDGSIDWYDPDELDLDSGTTGSGSVARVDVTVKVTCSGKFSFDWCFEAGDPASGCRFLWLSNGVARLLVENADAEGTSSFSVQANDTVGFRVASTSTPDRGVGGYVYITRFVGPGQEPSITLQPSSQSVCSGDYVDFYVELAREDTAFEYQWQFNGQDIQDETESGLNLAEVTEVNAGVYRLKISYPGGVSYSQEAALSVNRPPSNVLVTPQSARACAGQSATLTAAASGTEPLRYQWYLNGSALSGATGTTFVLSKAQSSDAGLYSVTVANDCGEATSGAAALVVDTASAISAQPASLVRRPGEEANFNVAATGTPPLAFQWLRNGAAIPGATETCIVIHNVQTNSAGLYSVVVSNGCGTAKSENALLVVDEIGVACRAWLGTNNAVQIGVLSSVPRRYVLEISSNLLAWVPLKTNDQAEARPVFTHWPDQAACYYRVHVPSQVAGPPTPPAHLQANAGASETSVVLSWSDQSADESGFIVERAHEPPGFLQIGAVPANQTTLTDTLPAAGSFWYRVRAKGALVDSDYSPEVQVCTLRRPTGLTCTPSADGRAISLAWADNSAFETGFVVERAPDGGGFSRVALVVANQVAFNNAEGIAPATCYQYRVQAVNDLGPSTYSDPVRVCTPGLPAQPINLTVSVGASGDVAALGWTDRADNESEFVLERSVNGGSFMQLGSTAANQTAYADLSVARGNCYRYRIKARNAVGDSPYSNEATANVPVAAPSGLSLNNSAVAQIQLSWQDNSGNESGFKVFRAIGSGTFLEYASVAANATGYTDAAVQAGAILNYRVQAYSVCEATPVLSEPTGVASALSAPVQQLPANDPDYSDRLARPVTISWSSVAGASGYRLVVDYVPSDGSSPVSMVNTTLTSTSYVPTSAELQSGRRYRWKVRALSSDASVLNSAATGYRHFVTRSSK